MPWVAPYSAQGRKRQRLGVHSDRDMRCVSLDDDLTGHEHTEAAPLPTPRQSPCLDSAANRDTDNAEHASVQPRPAPETGNVAHSVGVVAHRHRLRPTDDRTPNAYPQARPVLIGKQPGEHVQGCLGLVGTDQAKVDVQLDTVGQGVKASRGSSQGS
jgi:hypothetical protein